ncbi:hypothetical protein [Pseudomonas bohemica]|uniref:hypothetical protein n=1 Tax=Pseudomonas bohemica TaxID=2044872 RepID=UPI0018FF0DEC|nr:hypothetical protein [Pseudomonas bohemica]
MSCTGCAARRARAVKWLAIAKERASTLFKRHEKTYANPPEETPAISTSDTPTQDA